MAVIAVPTLTLKVVQPQLFLGLTEAILNGPTTEGYPKDFPQRPAIATSYAIRKKVFRFSEEKGQSTLRWTLKTATSAGTRAMHGDGAIIGLLALRNR